MKLTIKVLALLSIWTGCTQPKATEETAEETSVPSEVNVYTHRHYEPDIKLFSDFEAETGIKVNVVNASADELINRMEMEGQESPADVLITVDAGRLHRTKEKGLLQSVNSEVLNSNIPPRFRDKEGYWFGLTYRARIIAYRQRPRGSHRP